MRISTPVRLTLMPTVVPYTLAWPPISAQNNAQLGRGLVFDNEIASLAAGADADVVSEVEKGSEATGNFGKRRSERSRIEQMWEPDRSQESKGVRGTKGSGEQRGSGEPKGHGG